MTEILRGGSSRGGKTAALAALTTGDPTTRCANCTHPRSSHAPLGCVDVGHVPHATGPTVDGRTGWCTCEGFVDAPAPGAVAAPRRAGRPLGSKTLHPVAERRTPLTTVSVLDDERAAIVAAADACDLPLSVYIRRAAVFAARHLSSEFIKTRTAGDE